MTMVRQETFELSGFGGGYEDMCQRMLWRGVGTSSRWAAQPGHGGSARFRAGGCGTWCWRNGRGRGG